MDENMDKPKISIVAAISKTGAIGRGNDLLFKISDDLKRFKSLTKGHPVIMGRKTFESIGRPLPDRMNIVITRNPDWNTEGAVKAGSLEEALTLAENQLTSASPSEIFVIGGGEIYRQALPIADKLYLTIVESDAEGDTYFPDWREKFAKETFREERFDEETGLKYAWLDLER